MMTPERTKEEWKAYWEKFEKCPACGEKRTKNCRCPRADSTCPNGHHWHNCTVHGVVVLGTSDHGIDTCTCTCSKQERPVAEQKKWLQAQDSGLKD